MFPLQVPGGPELIVILLVLLVLLVPVLLVGAVALYLLGRRRNRVKELESRVEELESEGYGQE